MLVNLEQDDLIGGVHQGFEMELNRIADPLGGYGITGSPRCDRGKRNR